MTPQHATLDRETALKVAGRADDAEDLRELLRALGLLPCKPPRMTAHEEVRQLYAALDAARRERDWPWWRLEAAVDISECIRRRMRDGAATPAVCERAETWLERTRSA